ncbi:uncharacterized protein LOC100904791 [Galendromus occidentalis]|uniref:Uncharacterized protein LOC100904791 n=1 Tax=Galendromus occidentalis TaxID=34638 RepID=A0AAJ6QPG3_9ACAR|nr:uncharacterized protein LOC100904791 [Galendromus occidentalis]
MRQQQLSTNLLSGAKKDKFFMDLCSAFMKADIALHKLSNDALKNFLEHHTSMKIPEPSTLRKTYVPEVYADVIDRIRQGIACSKIWVSIDETTDRAGRSIANVIVGKLERTHFGRSYLLVCEQLEKCNATTIAHIFVKSMEILWNGDVHYDRVLIFVSDAARYMGRAAASLKVLFPRMIHVTCLAHGLHRVSEEIRGLFPKVDQLIASMKMVLLKSPSRISLFREEVELPLPPKPILTRWGTWIEAVEYYARNFEVLRRFVCEKLQADDALAIKTAQRLFVDATVQSGLVAIATHFSKIPDCITALEGHGLSLEKSLSIVEDLREEFRLLPTELSAISQKFENVLKNNAGFAELQRLRDFMRGEASGEDVVMPLDDQILLKFAPVVSCEVERSFSRYKSIFRDNRRSLLFENLKKYVVVACNQDID